ncbi:MAG: hypothetical protein AVDCRST_MAG75-2879, partial [uncultured Propionibacteriaceae bacterium]
GWLAASLGRDEHESRRVRGRTRTPGQAPAPRRGPQDPHRPCRVRRLGAHPAAALPRRQPGRVDPPKDHQGPGKSV